MDKPLKVSVCVKVSGVADANGDVFTADALRLMAERSDRFCVKEKPDGRVELWTRAHPIASPLSSKEQSDG